MLCDAAKVGNRILEEPAAVKLPHQKISSRVTKFARGARTSSLPNCQHSFSRVYGFKKQALLPNYWCFQPFSASFLGA